MIGNRNPGKMRTAFIWVLGTGVCCLLTWWLLNLRHAALRQPLNYLGGDEFPIAMWVKQMQETGWVLYNPRLGMPVPPEILNYPMPDAFNFFVLKCIGMIVKPYGLVMNIFFLAGFPLTFLASTYVLHRLRIGLLTAIFVSLLYSFLPFHFMRAESHMNLSAYYTVPLII